MPHAAPRPCRNGGCKALVTGRTGYCDTHRRDAFKIQKTTVSVDYKERNRFYQRKLWKDARQLRLSTEPLCRQCRLQRKLTAAEVVDHVIPIEHGGDPLAQDNLQSLCKSCHNAKTRHDDHRG